MNLRKKDRENNLFTGMHYSDWGVILIAALLTLTAAYLLLTPENYGAELAKAAKVLTTPQGQQAAPQATPGETSVTILPNKKK